VQMNVRSLMSICCPPFLRSTFEQIENSPIGLRLAHGVFWSMAGSVISRGLTLAATVLVARLLGKTVYGELGMIQSTVGMFGVFAGFGLGLTATKHVAEYRQSDPVRAGRIIGLSGLFATLTSGFMALGLFLFAPWLAEFTIHAPHLTDSLRIGALILFISGINGAQTGALSGFEAFKTIAYVNLFIGLLSFPILVCGAWFGGLTGAVWGLAINLCFNWLLNHWALRKEAHRFGVPFTLKGCGHEWSVLWRFSLPAVLAGAMVGPADWTCQAMLTSHPHGYDEMGTLTAALVFQGLLVFVSNMLSAPLLSMISNAGTSMSRGLGAVNILSSWILGVAVAVPLLCFPEIAQAVFGDDYASHSFKVTFSLVVFCASIITFKAGFERVMAANNLLYWKFCAEAFWATVLIASASFLVRWGAPGLAASLAIAHVARILFLLPLYYHRKLAPRGTLVSFESTAIWLILAFLVCLNIADAPLMARTLVFPPAVLLSIVSFKRLAPAKDPAVPAGNLCAKEE
jgi:O-antigen/teichoic acid export membrane protein